MEMYIRASQVADYSSDFNFFFHEGKWTKNKVKYSIHTVIQEETEKLPGYDSKAIFSKKRSPINISPIDEEQGDMAVWKSHTDVPEIIIFN